MNLLPENTPAPGFDEPLELLLACHGKIEAQCEKIRRLQEHLPQHGNDEQASQVALSILRYFDTAGRLHHEDEERDLFPHLLEADDRTLHQLIARLQKEHLDMDAAWQRLRPALLAIAENRSDKLDKRIASTFIEVHVQHIAIENGQLLPIAKKILNKRQLRALSHSMAVRRGVTL